MHDRSANLTQTRPTILAQLTTSLLPSRTRVPLPPAHHPSQHLPLLLALEITHLPALLPRHAGPIGHARGRAARRRGGHVARSRRLRGRSLVVVCRLALEGGFEGRVDVVAGGGGDFGRGGVGEQGACGEGAGFLVGVCVVGVGSGGHEGEGWAVCSGEDCGRFWMLMLDGWGVWL